MFYKIYLIEIFAILIIIQTDDNLSICLDVIETVYFAVSENMGF